MLVRLESVSPAQNLRCKRPPKRAEGWFRAGDDMIDCFVAESQCGDTAGDKNLSLDGVPFMRTGWLIAASALSIPLLLVAACSSDPAAPEIDEGIDNQEAGTSFGGSSGQGGSGGGGSVAYPPGPYGHAVGNVVQDFQFTGLMNPKAVDYVADNSTLKPIALHDFYNPTKDTSKPRVLFVTASARWCSVCASQATSAQADRAYWQPKGIEFLETMFEDENNEPAEPADLTFWAKKYKFEFPTVLDPQLKLGVFFDKSAAPFNMIIDLSNMTIVYAGTGLFDAGESNPDFSKALGE